MKAKDHCTREICNKSHTCERYFCWNQKIIMNYNMNHNNKTWASKGLGYDYDTQVIHRVRSLNKLI